MMRFSLFKATQPKGFDFKPRYYNPEKEEFEQRVAAIKAEYAREQGQTAEGVDHSALRGKIRSEWNAVSQRKSTNRSANYRVLLIAGLLALAFYVFLFTDFELAL